MTRLLIVAAALTLCALEAGAQEIPAKGTDSTRVEKKLSRPPIMDLQKELALTPEQAAKWDLISKQSRDKLATLNDDTTSDPELVKEQRSLVMKEQEKQLQEILTTVQKARLKELRKERRQKQADKQ